MDNEIFPGLPGACPLASCADACVRVRLFGGLVPSSGGCLAVPVVVQGGWQQHDIGHERPGRRMITRKLYTNQVIFHPHYHDTAVTSKYNNFYPHQPPTSYVQPVNHLRRHLHHNPQAVATSATGAVAAHLPRQLRGPLAHPPLQSSPPHNDPTPLFPGLLPLAAVWPVGS